MSIESVGFLLIVAAMVSIIARRVRLSYTVALVVTGIILGAFPIGSEFKLTPDLVFNLLLPPLIFEAALNIRWTELKRDFVFITTMATLGLLASIGVIYFGLVRLAGWNTEIAIVFAALISATDPVSVIAILKEAGQKGRLRLLLEAESLFNDGTAAVAFVAVLAALRNTPASLDPSVGHQILSFGGQFLLVSLGGVLAGALVALIGMTVAGRTEDHLVELLVTTVVAFGSFLLAEHYHASGVLASLTAGLLVANYGRISELTDKGRESIESFWEYAGFIANSIVFLLMGIHYERMPLATYWKEILIAIPVVLLGRALSVYGVSGIFAWSRWRATLHQQHLLFWGGLRGALALALVLSIPAEFPGAERLQAVTFSVVAFSVIVQGLSVKWLLARTVIPNSV